MNITTSWNRANKGAYPPPRGAAGRFSGNKLRRKARDIRHFPYIRGGKYF